MDLMMGINRHFSTFRNWDDLRVGVTSCSLQLHNCSMNKLTIVGLRMKLKKCWIWSAGVGLVLGLMSGKSRCSVIADSESDWRLCPGTHLDSTNSIRGLSSRRRSRKLLSTHKHTLTNESSIQVNCIQAEISTCQAPKTPTCKVSALFAVLHALL